ncbi:MAG: DsrH/TusB family sulfur metabolism protein [Actinomycetota bacterium]|nr:DsrH/TusB family sulfur metabolism protein [Actinomycetota bacterium]
MGVYLLDKPFGDIGLKIASHDSAAKVVLIKDGVYLDTSKFKGGKIYAMKDDVEKRGLGKKLSATAELIDYPHLVDMIVDDKVMNFI